LCSQDDFASQAINDFETAALGIGLEVVISAEFPYPGTLEEITEAMKLIQASGAKVRFVMCPIRLSLSTTINLTCYSQIIFLGCRGILYNFREYLSSGT